MNGLRWVVVLSCLGSLGCAEKGPAMPVPMGAAAPVFGSSDKVSTVGGFLEGMWCPPFDVEAQVKYLDYWEFKSDGTFIYSKIGTKNKVGGSWKDIGKGIWLTYETFDGGTIEQALQNAQKEAETGTQSGIIREQELSGTLTRLNKMRYLELDENKKDLYFTDPGASDTEGLMGGMGGGSLVRVTMPDKG